MADIKFTVSSTDFKKIGGRMDSAAEKAEHIIANQIAKDTEDYVPASQDKNLSKSTRVAGGTIIYPGPYARFLYYGKLMIDPETGSAWARKGASKVIAPSGANLDIKKGVHGKAQSHWFEASKAQNLQKWRRAAGKVMKDEFKR